MRSINFIPLMHLFFVLALAFGVSSGLTIEDAVEKAVLKGNWEEVFETFEKDDTKANDPVARLLMGHACLATNRNNESMLLFISAKAEDELTLWSGWTESLLHRHPQSPVAHYLVADAKARVGRLEKAIAGFSQALTIKEDFVLALNARGVVHVLINEYDKALRDFYQATTFAPEFADAHASLGTYWILEEAPEGALEEFNKALAINPEFALAYNGRGCAYFGRGKYEYGFAIADMEKAYELCPVLLPALSNQGLVLAAMTSQLRPSRTDTTKLGVTFITKSDLERMDYTSFTSADQMIKFHNSVKEISKNDPVAALRVYSAQLAKVGNRMDELSNLIEERSRVLVANDRMQKHLRTFNRTLTVADKLIDAGKNAMYLVPQPKDNWRVIYDLSRKIFPSIPATPIIGEIMVFNEAFKYAGNIYRNLAEKDIGMYSTELAVRTRQYHNLQHEQGTCLTQAINQGVDFSKVDIMDWLDIGPMSMPTTTQDPIPEYSIPRQSPLTQFSVLPGAIGKDIAPVGKIPLVVIDGDADAYRLGAMLRGFEERGVKTLPAPSNMDAQSFGRMVRADRVLKITKEPGSAAWLPKVPVVNPEVGGVTQDMSHAHVDLGNWPVMTTFSLFYKTGTSTSGLDR